MKKNSLLCIVGLFLLLLGACPTSVVPPNNQEETNKEVTLTDGGSIEKPPVVDFAPNQKLKLGSWNLTSSVNKGNARFAFSLQGDESLNFPHIRCLRFNFWIQNPKDSSQTFNIPFDLYNLHSTFIGVHGDKFRYKYTECKETLDCQKCWSDKKTDCATNNACKQDQIVGKCTSCLQCKDSRPLSYCEKTEQCITCNKERTDPKNKLCSLGNSFVLELEGEFTSETTMKGTLFVQDFINNASVQINDLKGEHQNKLYMDANGKIFCEKCYGTAKATLCTDTPPTSSEPSKEPTSEILSEKQNEKINEELSKEPSGRE